MSGGDGEKVTPVPIPNTEVKLLSADGSWGFPPVRVGRRRAGCIFIQSSKMWIAYPSRRNNHYSAVAQW